MHCVRLARDGLVYVCDRQNDRIQVFRRDGTYLREIIIAPNTLGSGSVWDIDFLPDAAQSVLLTADGSNNTVWLLAREAGEIIGRFGRSGRNAGEFHWVHNMAVDSRGNVFTTEVDTGNRAQRFRVVSQLPRYVEGLCPSSSPARTSGSCNSGHTRIRRMAKKPSMPWSGRVRR